MINDPSFEKVLVNSQVRVFRADIASSHESMLDLHRHDYIVVSLGKNQFEVEGEANRFAMDMQDGESQVLTGGWPHRLKNTSTASVHLLLVEITRGIDPSRPVCGLAGRGCHETKFGRSDEGDYQQTLLFETEKVRLLRAELGPGGSLPVHVDKNDHILLSLTTSMLSDGLSDPVQESIGGAVWQTGGLGMVKNAGTDKARMLVVELK